MVAKTKKTSKPTLRQSRVWAAQDRFNAASKNYKEVGNTPVKTTYWMTSLKNTRAYEISREDNARFDKAADKYYSAMKNLKQEQKRAKDYSRARANWKKLLNKTRA